MHNYTCEVSSRGCLADWARVAPRSTPDGAPVSSILLISSAGTEEAPRELSSSPCNPNAAVLGRFGPKLSPFYSTIADAQILSDSTGEARIGGRCLMCNAGGTFLVNCSYKQRVQEVDGQRLRHQQSENSGNSDSETICTHEVVKLDRHHRPQFRAREDRRAGSIVQAPCTIAPIAEIPSSNPLCRPEAMRPIWGARFCRARVASHRSRNAPRSRDASRQSACVHSPLFIPALTSDFP